MPNEDNDEDAAQMAQKPQQIEITPAVEIDEAEPDDILFDLELAEITSTELKPVNAAYVDLISNDPEKAKAREKAKSDYAEAMKTNGELEKLYGIANSKFVELAKDIEKSPHDVELLKAWCKNLAETDPDKPFYKMRDLIARQSALTERFTTQASRYRFADVIYKKAKAERIGKNYAEWLAPANAIKGRIESYLADIVKIDAALDSNEDSDWPIYQFWFVVAPKHLQLRRETVSQTNTPGFNLINDALTDDIANRKKLLLAGPDRKDGSIYTVKSDDYLAKRKAALERWRKAVEAYARAVAANKFRPDEPAKLQPRIKELAEGEAANVKALLGV
jgi:hypothetical protein